MINNQLSILKERLRSGILLAVIFAVFSIGFSNSALAQEAEAESDFNAGEMIMHHIVDSHVWHLWDGHYGTIYLPIIVYSSERGVDVFMSSNFYDDHHNTVPYNGYLLEHEHISFEQGEGKIYDFSITKNVASLLVNSFIMVLVFMAVSRGYKKNVGKGPTGIQSFFEPIIVYIRDEIVKPNIGKSYEKYLPYLLTLFFFIWFSNLIGLMPGSANLTGNIAVTLSLAVFTFIIVNVSGNKNYWTHVFWTPGVPLPLRIIILPVELIGVFTKPISLMIRLFVAISAGHIVLLSLIGLTFIFSSWMVGFGSTIILLFINLIEILVATIQAYVFTMFTSLYIGMATEEHH